jgi:NADH dehydrogenase FAD-containing subunit
MVRQFERQLRGEPLLPYTYRDCGSLVSLGKHTTVGSLMGFLFGRARVMYRSLRSRSGRGSTAFSHRWGPHFYEQDQPGPFPPHHR